MPAAKSILPILTLIILPFFFATPVMSATNGNTNVSLQVACNENGVCEPETGENGLNCPTDCPICNNDGICQRDQGENASNCSNDCPICNNNDICETDFGENASNCANDCQICNNNGTCEPNRGENYQNCLSDCPQPVTPPANPLAAGIPGQSFMNTKPTIISNLKVTGITLNSANISWDTDKAARCQTTFGLNADYEKGALSETSFVKQHSEGVTGLLPGTTYHFKIRCHDAFNNSGQTLDQEFSTLPLPDVTPPSNVGNFEATAGDGQVTLKWENPTDKDLKGIRIVRSEKFYPKDQWAGELVYEGPGLSAVDTGLTNGKAYYYTAFSFDASGNYASGAIVSAIPGEAGVIPEIPVIAAPPEIEKIDLPQFDFIQDGKKITPLGGTVTIDRFQPMTISIPYESVPEVLKTLMVTLKQGDKIFSFLLRTNEDKTAYEATLVPPDSGAYPFTITILDYKNQAFKKITGELNIVKASLTQAQTVQYAIIKKAPPIIYILFAMIVLFSAEEVCRAVRKYRRNSKLKIQNSQT